MPVEGRAANVARTLLQGVFNKSHKVLKNTIVVPRFKGIRGKWQLAQEQAHSTHTHRKMQSHPFFSTLASYNIIDYSIPWAKTRDCHQHMTSEQQQRPCCLHTKHLTADRQTRYIIPRVYS